MSATTKQSPIIEGNDKIVEEEVDLGNAEANVTMDEADYGEGIDAELGEGWLEKDEDEPCIEEEPHIGEEPFIEVPTEDREGVEECETREFVEDIPPPTKGMQFESARLFMAHIDRYGYSNGFQVRIRSSDKVRVIIPGGCKCKAPKTRGIAHKHASEEHYSKYVQLRLECTKAGLPKVIIPELASHSCRTNCQFKVRARKSELDGSWTITSVTIGHNHETRKENSRFLPRYRNISAADRKIALENHRSGVKIGSNYSTFITRYGGYADVPFTERDLRKLINAYVRRVVTGGDFNDMERHFQDMKKRSPNFYHEYDIDEDGQILNVFWADGRSRAAAKYFGDVVSFDSTYVTNRYRMPFLPFVGLNHHGNSLLLGCSLLTIEDAKSYEWVFQAWLRCMGSALKAIITDQCRAIGKAVNVVFPDARHRLCIWHIKRNLSKNLGSNKDWFEINKEFGRMLSHRVTIEEFEQAWKEWEIKYNLGCKVWCKDLYKDRKRWVLVYFKGEFWAGMSSTQRSEGMNHFFKGFVNANTTLKVFLDQYGLAVEKRANEETSLVFSDENRTWKRSSKHVFDLVFQELLTAGKFREVQVQIQGLLYANGRKVEMNGDEGKYEVVMTSPREGLSRKRTFSVWLNKNTMDLKCECNNFEFKGIICTHALSILVLEAIDIVPEKYLYPRWRKDIPKEFLKEALPYNDLAKNRTPVVNSYNEMSKVCARLCLAAMENEVLFKEIMAEFEKLSVALESKIDPDTLLTSYIMGGVGRVYGRKCRRNQADNMEKESAGVKDPSDRRGKGRTPKVRKGADLDKKIASGRKKNDGKRKRSETMDNNEARHRQQQQPPASWPHSEGVHPQFSPFPSQYVVYPSSSMPGYSMSQRTMPLHTFWAPTFHGTPPLSTPGTIQQSPCASSQPSTSSQTTMPLHTFWAPTFHGTPPLSTPGIIQQSPYTSSQPSTSSQRSMLRMVE